MPPLPPEETEQPTGPVKVPAIVANILYRALQKFRDEKAAKGFVAEEETLP